MRTISSILFILLFLCLPDPAFTESGYDLWLRYEKVKDENLLRSYQTLIKSFSVPGSSPTRQVIEEELQRGLTGLLNKKIEETTPSKGSLVIALIDDYPKLGSFFDPTRLEDIGPEGFIIQTDLSGKTPRVFITANTDLGLLYGTFYFLKLLQTHQSIEKLNLLQRPDTDLRVLNHWDNLDRTSERGYAGFSIWDWHRLPEYIDPRYIDYARANASVGINGVVLTNVNANALVLTQTYLEKVKALAEVFRPYGIRVFLTARFSAPIEIGKLPTADPMDTAVITWWKNKVAEVYGLIPDFGGFLVKANSEGQPGPQNYGRSHAQGANMLATALAPFQGVVMWRAFVYSNEEPEDRAKQAFNEFRPLDGHFLDNVLIQVKNGAIDFQPREPFHPLFGAMPETPLMMEFQITQEYLGQATHLVYLAPMWKECLNSDTYARGKGSTVASVINGSLHDYAITGIAGVANIGTDINWTGHPFAQANWYAFGRLAWDTDLHSEEIADDWIKMTFGPDENIVHTTKSIMLNSWEATVNYMTPLGLHHLMGTSHHYGPAPWVNDLGRADWNPVYYHQADSTGIGFDRSASGSNAIEQYHPEVRKQFATPESCPEKFLLWFHHVPWEYQKESGRTLWEELAFRYQDGINSVREFRKQWDSLSSSVDKERHTQVSMLLARQEKEAIWWKNASMLYFQTFSGLPFPEFMEAPDQALEYYQSLRFPYAPGIRPGW